ncbi:MAG: ferredoxin [Roseovarius sp.]|nr:ferredoxin [Roseovarius sp.]
MQRNMSEREGAMYLKWQESRAQRVHPDKGLLRPPGTVGRRQLAETCTGCGDCVEVCPAQALALDPMGYPHVTDAGRCEQCGLCADVCMKGVIAYTSVTLRGRERALVTDRAVLGAADLPDTD